MEDQSDNNWSVVLMNIRKVRKVWGRLGKLLRREGADPFVSSKLYCSVVQAVLILGADTWVMSAAMLENSRAYMWVSYIS